MVEPIADALRAVLDHLVRAVEPACRRFERWCGFGHGPSDDGHVVTVSPGAVGGGPELLCGALVGPIAILNAAPASKSNANASGAIATVAAPITTSRRT